MKTIRFYLDFLSPYSYLAFEKLPETLTGLSYHVRYTPVLLGALLHVRGVPGPAEVAGPKRDWTYRHALWLGHAHDIPIDLPATHPYNPLPHLRLALATAREGGDVSRFVCETIFRDIWRGGAEAVEAARLQALAARVHPVRDAQDEAVKAQLRTSTEAALNAGVFGVPCFEVDGQLFWGFDSLPMLRDYLDADPWFGEPGYVQAGQRPGAAPAARPPAAKS